MTDDELEYVGEPSRRTREAALSPMRARRAFAKHVITKRDDRRWLLQSLHEDGRPDWTMAAEVIVLAGGGLYVGGDIDHVIFAHGPAEPLARLRWMGECKDLGYYVSQKARIGTGRELVDRWDQYIASEELRAYVAENADSVEDEDALDGAFVADSEARFYDQSSEAFSRDCDFHDARSDMGRVLEQRVVYAHAALARLCELLREEERAAAGAT